MFIDYSQSVMASVPDMPNSALVAAMFILASFILIVTLLAARAGLFDEE